VTLAKQKRTHKQRKLIGLIGTQNYKLASLILGSKLTREQDVNLRSAKRMAFRQCERQIAITDSAAFFASTSTPTRALRHCVELGATNDHGVKLECHHRVCDASSIRYLASN